MTASAASDDSSLVTPDDALYVRNMRALFRSDAALAQQIDECVPDGSVSVEPARRGSVTAAVRVGDDDRPRYLHSRVAPEEEAKRFAEAVDLEAGLCCVLGGFGLGHHLLALAERLADDGLIIVTEPNLQILKAAFEHVDLTALFESRRCLVLTSADKGHLQTRLEPHNTLLMMGTQFVTHPASEQVAGGFHARMRKLVADHLTFCRMSLVTLVTNARITHKNIANNFPRYLSTPPIDVLRDRFRGKPAVLVAAGPSLRRNIDQLAELKGRAVIITVQTTFKTLLDHGIEPDFVTSLDYHEMSKRYFEDLDGRQGTHLIAEPKVTWHVLDNYPGPTSVLFNNFARLCLGDKLAARDGLKAGATVAHLSLYWAVYLGCEPIIMVGQDLAYTNHVYYTPGVAMHGLWRPQLNRYCTMEMMEWERIARFREILLKVKDIHDHDIYTDEQLFTYQQQFEGDFSTIPGRVIDATEGGVRKAATQVMSLAEAAKRFCTEPLPAELFAYRDRLNWDDSARLEAGRDELRQRVAEVDRMTATCERMHELLGEMFDLLDRPSVFNRRIADVDALRVEIHQQDHTYQMISAVSQHAELQRFTADRKLKLTGARGVDLARGQLERDKRFVEAVVEGGGALKAILAESIQRFDDAIARRGA